MTEDIESPTDFTGNIRNAGSLNSTDPYSLRQWWHEEILGNHGRYSSYGIFLVLPSDIEAIHYLSDYGKELDLMSGENCLIIALSESEVRRSSFDEEIWNASIREDASNGHSKKVAELFNINYDKFPCLVVFDDIRSPEHVVIPLKSISAEEISKRMRSIFTVIQQAASKTESPIYALETHLGKEYLLEKGKTILSYAGKTFEKAMEVWMTAYIKASVK